MSAGTSVKMSRVVVVTDDTVAEKMAGPAIRAWQIASHLAIENEVRLVSTSSQAPTRDRARLGPAGVILRSNFVHTWHGAKYSDSREHFSAGIHGSLTYL